MDKKEQSLALLEREFKARYGTRLTALLEDIGSEIRASQNADDLYFLHEYLGEAFRQVHEEIRTGTIVEKKPAEKMN